MTEREKFEKWYAETGSMFCDMDGYWWECWQAALSAAPTPPEVSGLREVSGVEEVKELAAASGKRTLALLSSTLPEVEPVAEVVAFGCEIAVNFTGGIGRFPIGTKLYTSPPSPKAEDGMMTVPIQAYVTRFAYEALGARIRELESHKAEWDAEGNPLNLDAAREIVRLREEVVKLRKEVAELDEILAQSYDRMISDD